MTPEHLWNRATNLVATTIVALAGFAFLPEFFLEDEIPHKVDDGLLFILGLVAIGWCTTGGNRLKRSIVPLVLTWLALIVKIGGLFLEFSDGQDAGDDFGGLILFVFAALFISWLYSRKMPRSP